MPILVVLAVPAGASASPTQRMLFEAPRELRSGDAGLRARTLDEIHALGARWLRVVMYWQDVAPRPGSRTRPRFAERDPASYDWTIYDRIVQEADARGFRLLLTVTGPVPRWATSAKRDRLTRPSATRFGRFMEAVARRYGPTVDAYAIWNEPNHPAFLRPQWTRRGKHRQATAPRLYRKLFFHGAAGLRAGGAGRTPVLFGETAPRGNSRAVGPITFMRVALCLNGRWQKRRGCHRAPADGYAHHAYTPRSGPFYVPPHRGDVTIRVLSRLKRALTRAERARAVPRGLRIWLTEFGIQSWPDRIYGVSESTQAEYRSIAERMAYRDRRVVAFSQYLMRDDDPIAGVSKLLRYSGFQTGLRGSGGKRKRAYAAFRLPLVAVAGRRRTTLWGLVRPAHRRTRVSIDYRVRGSKRWHFLKHDATNARGAWTTTTAHRSNRRYRVRWRAPDGRRYTGPATRAHRSA